MYIYHADAYHSNEPQSISGTHPVYGVSIVSIKMVGSGGRGRALVVRVFVAIVLMRCLPSAGQYPVCSLYALYIDRRDLPVNLAFSKLSIVYIINVADAIVIYFLVRQYVFQPPGPRSWLVVE